MQYALALHTTSSQLGLAIDSFDHERYCQTWDLGRSLSTHLHAHLTEFVQPYGLNALAFLATAQGPGSFTSTRIGIVTARTLAQQLNIPLFAVSSLAAWAWFSVQNHHRLDEAPIPDIAVQLPAQRGEIFAAIYAIQAQKDLEGKLQLQDITALLPDTALPTDRWTQHLENWQRPFQQIAIEQPTGCSAANLLDIAWVHWNRGERPDWSTAIPFYGQSCVT